MKLDITKIRLDLKKKTKLLKIPKSVKHTEANN